MNNNLANQGGKLEKSKEFITVMKKRYNYTVEPTGADSPSQNGGAKRVNDSLAVTVRALLYSWSLEPKYWSDTLLHEAWLHDLCVHSVTKRMPFEG